MVLGGEENFLKKAFLPRTPSFKNFETGVWVFIVISALNARTTYVRTVLREAPSERGLPTKSGGGECATVDFALFSKKLRNFNCSQASSVTHKA